MQVVVVVRGRHHAARCAARRRRPRHRGHEAVDGALGQAAVDPRDGRRRALGALPARLVDAHFAAVPVRDVAGAPEADAEVPAPGRLRSPMGTRGAPRLAIRCPRAIRIVARALRSVPHRRRPRLGERRHRTSAGGRGPGGPQGAEQRSAEGRRRPGARGRVLAGWTPAATGFMARRTAATHAWALLPLLRPGMDLLDVGCGPGLGGGRGAVGPGRGAARLGAPPRRALRPGVGGRRQRGAAGGYPLTTRTPRMNPCTPQTYS